MKFISSTGGAENFFANVSIGYAQGMYYLSSSGLECKVEKQATIDAKNYVAKNYTAYRNVGKKVFCPPVELINFI